VSVRIIDIILKNTLLNGMYNLICLVSTVSSRCKKHSEKQALVAGTKQSKQAERAVRAA